MSYSRRLAAFLPVALLMAGGASAAHGQSTLNGLGKVAEWTDFENQSNEMPAQVWGGCDLTLEDRVGIRVLFQDGTYGEATYSGLASHWNSGKFTPIPPDTSAGFLTDCGTGMHYLYNDGIELPLAWDNCSMVYSNNFDLDYDEQNGSHFRASTTGWVEATFQTYCAAGSPLEVPAASPGALLVLALALALLGSFSLRRSRHRES